MNEHAVTQHQTWRLEREPLEMVGLRYETARQNLLLAQLGYRDAMPLEALIEPLDALHHMPSILRSMPLYRLLMLSSAEVLALPGVGKTKLNRLAICLEIVGKEVVDGPDADELARAAEDERHEPAVLRGIRRSPQFADAPVREAHDRTTHERIVAALSALGLYDQPVGRAIPSLRQCPQRIAELSFRELLNQQTVERILGTPSARYGPVVTLLREVPELAEQAYRLDVTIDFIARHVAHARDAIRALLNERRTPSLERFRTKVLGPLLEQVEQDGGETCCEVARCRLGLRRIDRGLSDIADHVGLSRQRVQQLVVRARRIMEMRWREGEYLLDDLCDLLQRNPDSFPVYALCWRIFALFYPKRLAHKGSSSVLWSNAGVGLGSHESEQVIARTIRRTRAQENRNPSGDAIEEPNTRPYIHAEIQRLLGT